MKSSTILLIGGGILIYLLYNQKQTGRGRGTIVQPLAPTHGHISVTVTTRPAQPLRPVAVVNHAPNQSATVSEAS